jgi:predicted aconitase
MEKIRTIREALNYSHQFRGVRIVIKLGRRVTEEARERGIFSDISKIKQAGVNVVIIHANPNLDPAQWESSRHVVKKRNMFDTETIKTYMALGIVPIIYETVKYIV